MRILSADQSRKLLDVQRDVAWPASRNALRQLARRMSEILGVKVAFATMVHGAWSVIAESGPDPRLPAAGTNAWKAIDGATGVEHDAEAWRSEDSDWTVVRLPGRASAPVVLVLEDDWTLSSANLRFFVTSLPVPDPALAVLPRALPGAEVHRLSRALGNIQGLPRVCGMVLRHCVRAVPSRLASFAVATEEGHLSIVATHGYPQELVEQMRIAPGSGIIGRVYRDRTPLCVEDVSTLQGLHRRRPRYRTGSFVAVPVRAGGEVLGVVCLSDPLDDRAYTPNDLSRIRRLTAPAALALGRERARRQADEFARAAIIDPVSGLYNRRYFHDRLDEELQRARRQKTVVALLMIDIDDFKKINDRFGHMVGDTVIKAVSDILRRSVRKFDLCTRFGGEEFAIVMPGSGMESAASIAERIRQRIEAFRADERELSDLRVTASIGLSIAEDSLPRELIVRADRALYGAKRTGKNRVVSGPLDTPLEA